MPVRYGTSTSLAHCRLSAHTWTTFGKCEDGKRYVWDGKGLPRLVTSRAGKWQGCGNNFKRGRQWDWQVGSSTHDQKLRSPSHFGPLLISSAHWPDRKKHSGLTLLISSTVSQGLTLLITSTAQCSGLTEITWPGSVLCPAWNRDGFGGNLGNRALCRWAASSNLEPFSTLTIWWNRQNMLY